MMQLGFAVKNVLHSTYYNVFTICLIFISIFIVTNDNLNLYNSENSLPYSTIEWFIAVFFLTDYVLRIVTSKFSLKYLFSLHGLVDFLASVPFFLGVLAGVTTNSNWARVLRLVSISRTLKTFQEHSLFGGIFGRVFPYALTALGVKLLILNLEVLDWWIIASEFNIVLGVIGFSLAVLMGAKLTTVNGRLYDIEDAVCRVVGSMRDMWFNKSIQSELLSWSTKLESFLKAGYADRLSRANDLRTCTDALEHHLESIEINGPNTAGFHRDVAFLIHRATVKTPRAYNNFLISITIIYVAALIIGIPGGMGVVASFLSTIVLGGVYFLVEDLDDPLGYYEESFIDARLDALEYWNDSKKVIQIGES